MLIGSEGPRCITGHISSILVKRLRKYRGFLDFQDVDRLPSWVLNLILKLLNLTIDMAVSLFCISVQYFVEIGQTVAEIWQFFIPFKDGGRPQSLICWVRIRVTHKRAQGGLYRWSIDGILITLTRPQALFSGTCHVGQGNSG